MCRPNAAASILTLALCAGAIAATADQLAWITKPQAEAAVAQLTPGSIVVAWCSACSEKPQVWSVDRASVIQTSDPKYSQVVIEGKALSRGRAVVERGTYRDPIEYESVPARPLRKEVDLAYVYVRAGGDRFTVLSDVLHLTADVPVRTMTVPASATVARAVERGPASPTVFVFGTGSRDAMDSAADIRKILQEKRAADYVVVDSRDDAEATVEVKSRAMRQEQEKDAGGQPMVDSAGNPKMIDSYEIVARVAVLDEADELHNAVPFTSVAPWRDAAQGFVGVLDGYLDSRQHKILQARPGFAGLLGARIEEMDDAWRAKLSAKKAKGAGLVTVDASGPAAAAGLKPGDTITEIDGKKTKHAWDVARAVWTRGPGATLRLKVKTNDAERVVSLTTGS